MGKIRAVIFDLDGTLLDTIADIADSLNSSLASMHLKTYTAEEIKYFVGNGVDELVRNALSHQEADQALAPTVKAGYLATYALHQHDKTRPYPGIRNLLRDLSSAGIALAVLSNKPDPDTQTVIGYYFPSVRFAYVVGKRPGYAVKPDPKAANEIVAGLGMSQDEILYVGDTYTDMLTAKNAGLVPIGVLWGFRQAEELRSSGAKFLVSEPFEILALVKEEI